MRKALVRSLISGLSIAGLALTPLTATAGPKIAHATPPAKAAPGETLALDTIIAKHLAALGGEPLLRSTRTMTYTSTGEKLGQKFTKTVRAAAPNQLRIDIAMEDGTSYAKGFDGTVAWTRTGTAPAQRMTGEDARAMKRYADFGEPLLDYAKKGHRVRLVGTTEVASRPAYELEVAFASGDVVRQFIDASSFLVVQQISTRTGTTGAPVETTVQLGDYRKVAGRLMNHRLSWNAEDGSTSKAVISKVAFDVPMPASLFAMPAR